MNTPSRRSVVAVIVTGSFCIQPALGVEWDHVHLTATDTLAAAQWYSKHFGSQPSKAGRFDAIVYGTTVVKFKEGIPNFKGSAGSVVDHIGFSVPDTRTKMKELEQAGVKVIAQPRYSDRGDFYYGFVEDPWGTKIEIIDDKDQLGFHHVHLMVPDPNAAAAWFADTFGGKVTLFKGLSGLPSIRYGDMWLVMSAAKGEVASNHERSVDHIGWKVPDMEAIVKKLKSQGTKFFVEPQKAGNVILAFVEGPSGVKIEIQQVVDE
jgi:catechol 2,3-dioxygenase-like lactoylglutathione lyase family enzyme